jgi:hypothetical protein
VNPPIVKRKGNWFWAGVALLSVGAFFWCVLGFAIGLELPEEDGIVLAIVVVISSVLTGIGAYCVRRSRKLPADNIVHYDLTMSSNEAQAGTKTLLVRRNKRLEVSIPAGVSNGSLVKLSGALEITDGQYGDILIHIKVRKYYRKSVFRTFGFWSLILCIPGSFATVGNLMFFIMAIILGSLQFRRHVSKYSVAGFALGLAGLVFFIVLNVHILNYPPSPSHIYTNEIREIGGDYKPIELINNPDAKNPSYDELLAFIQTDTTDRNLYIETFFWGYVCTDYAEDVHNNAEVAGIRAAWVSMYFEGEEIGHAINAFVTTDKGLVYIDCTQTDTVAYVEEGKEYGCIDLAEAYSPSYSFYDEYKEVWQEVYESLGVVEELYIHW